LSRGASVDTKKDAEKTDRKKKATLPWKSLGPPPCPWGEKRGKVKGGKSKMKKAAGASTKTGEKLGSRTG